MLSSNDQLFGDAHYPHLVFWLWDLVALEISQNIIAFSTRFWWIRVWIYRQYQNSMKACRKQTEDWKQRKKVWYSVILLTARVSWKKSGIFVLSLVLDRGLQQSAGVLKWAFRCCRSVVRTSTHTVSERLQEYLAQTDTQNTATVFLLLVAV